MKKKSRPNVSIMTSAPEIWKQYKDTNLWVSSEGRFASTYLKDKLVNPTYHKQTNSYRIHADGKFLTPAKVVWEAFKGPIPEGYCVVNKRGYRSMFDIYSLELVPRSKVMSESSSKRAKRIINLETGEIYRNAEEAAKKLFICGNHIRAIARGLHKGSEFKLAYEKVVHEDNEG